MQLLLLSLCVITQVIRADIYMHNPRGSNDRGCETNENRDNGNRLFDSQNNAKGGYACQAAYPFACYLLPNEGDRDACNELNANAPDDLTTVPNRLMDNGGIIVANNPTAAGGAVVATRTERLFFIEGSQLTVEWTNQHGCGDNPKLHCDVIIQFACEDTLTDDCGEPGSGKTCGPRDGLPITNSDSNRGNAVYQNILNNGQTQIDRRARDRDATATIPVSISNNVQSDPRFGRHEPLQFFLACARRERNKGLFAADQNINGQSALHTRQNNNGNRNGLECPEESEYFPYWHPTPWKDVAILTDQIDRCEEFKAESQNVKAKNICECPTCIAQNRLVPNQEQSCLAAGGQWISVAPFNIAAPYCGKAPTSRENHLGNQVGQGAITATAFNWTIPQQAQGDTCVLRIRYNISTGDDISAADQRDVTVFGTSALNGQNSPIKDRQNNEAQTYLKFTETNAKVGLAINTNQFGRTFQDRSLTFSIKPRPASGPCNANIKGKIYNLNVRGKRGNIVQTYPAVEYDFVPSELSVTTEDCVHVQWTGSDYNPARNDNDAFGGPNDPKNMNNGRADRSNLVQMAEPSANRPVAALADMTLFTASIEEKTRLVFLDQRINDPAACLDIAQIQQLSQQARQNGAQFTDNGNNFLDQDEDRDRFFKNCAKLSGQRTPYFNGGVLQAGVLGKHAYFSTRNTCFSNRDQRGILNVLPEGSIPDDAGDPGANTGAGAAGTDPIPIVAGVGGGIAAMLGLAGLVAYQRRSSRGSNSSYSGSGSNLKERAQETFSNFRQSFANFGSGFSAFGGGGAGPQQNNNGGGGFGGGYFAGLRSSFAQFRGFDYGGQQQQQQQQQNMGQMASSNPMMMGGMAPPPRSMMPPPVVQQPREPVPSQMSMMNMMGGGRQGGGAPTPASMGLQRATAMYEHRASESGELSFRKGDVLTVLRRDQSGWWEGELNGQRGIFPANYVRVQSAGWN